MDKKKHFLIYSHGFGVRKDDRGLFTDIAASMPACESILFDYHEVDEQQQTITVRPFSQQAKHLATVVKEQQEKNPDAIFDLVCHSQGSWIAALACSTGIRKTILLAPAADVGIERTLARYQHHPKAEIHLDGISRLPRTDGGVTLVPAAYWRERMEERSPMEAYQVLAHLTELIVIKGDQDAVLGETSFDGLDSVQVITISDGDHDFTGAARFALLETVKRLLL